MKIIGITACPTGIAHTYMAQECLEKECRKRGFDVRISVYYILMWMKQFRMWKSW